MSLVGHGLLCLGSGETEAQVCSREGAQADLAGWGPRARTTRPLKVVWQLLDIELLLSQVPACVFCVRSHGLVWPVPCGRAGNSGVLALERAAGCRSVLTGGRLPPTCPSQAFPTLCGVWNRGTGPGHARRAPSSWGRLRPAGDPELHLPLPSAPGRPGQVTVKGRSGSPCPPTAKNPLACVR